MSNDGYLKPYDIARVTFESIQLQNNQIMMQYEDQLSHLTREIFRLTKICNQRKKHLQELSSYFKKYSKNTISKSLLQNDENKKYGQNMSSTSSTSHKTHKNELEIQVEELSPDLLIGENEDNDELMNDIPSTRNLKRSVTQPNTNKYSTICHDVPKRLKSIDVIRNKQDRLALPGHTCLECERFYEALLQQGILNEENQKVALLQECSRHKSKFTQNETAESFWDINVNTPEKWKIKK